MAINPQAGSHKQRKAGPALVDALSARGHEVVVLIAANYAELDRAVRDALQDDDRLVVVGGDGMVNLGINALVGTSASLAVLPAGTGNDYARGLGYNVVDMQSSIAQVLQAIERDPITMDLARVQGEGQDHYFGGALSCGFDALVNERANRMRFPRGASRYTWAIFLELLQLRPRNYDVTIDGVARRDRGALMSIANNSFMGGGMIITPQGSMQDGLLEVFLVKPVSRRRLIRLLPTVFRGEHINEPEVEIVHAREVTIDSPGIVAYADGERMGALPLTVSVVPGAIRVHLPD